MLDDLDNRLLKDMPYFPEGNQEDSLRKEIKRLLTLVSKKSEEKNT